MLRRKRGSASACSLTSSCRIKAEALARAFNRRIWPCTWVDRRARTRSVTDEYDDEEYFEAQDEDGRGRDNSVARDDKTKLFEILIQQQQSVDDAMDVFYDVSEHIVSQLSDCNIGGGIVLNQPNSIRCCELEAHGSLGRKDLNGTSDSLNVTGEIVPLEAGNTVVLKQPNSINLCETYENSSVECNGLIGVSDTLAVNREINPQNTVNAGVVSVLNQLISISTCQSNKSSSVDLRGLKCIPDSLNVNGEIHPPKSDNVGVVIVVDPPNSLELCESSENGPSIRSDLIGIPDDLYFNDEDDGYTQLGNSIGFNKNDVRQKVKKESVNSCYSQKCLKENNLNLSREKQSINSINSLNGDDGMIISLCQLEEVADKTCLLNGINEENHKNIPPGNKEFLEVESTECLSTCEGILEKNVPQHLQSRALQQNVCNSTNYCDSDSSFADLKTEKSFECNGILIDQESVKECKIDTDLVPEKQLHFPSNCLSNRDRCHPVYSSDSIRSTKELWNSSIPSEMISVVTPQETVESFYKNKTFDFEKKKGEKAIEDLHGADETLIGEERIVNEKTANTVKTSNLNYKIQECSSSQKEMAKFNLVSETCITDGNKLLSQEVSLTFPRDQKLKEAYYPISCCEDNHNGPTEVESAADLHTNKEQKVANTLQNEISDLSLSYEENEIQNYRPKVLIPECLNNKNESLSCKRTDDMVDIKVISDDSLETDSEAKSPTKTTNDNCRLQVFNEVRPMISRSTSLKTGKTPPGTPSRKKIVRFADVLGLDLEDVRHIVSGDLPIIPSSAYSDLVLDDLSPAASVCNKIELNHRQPSPWESLQGTAGPNTLYPKFEVPGQQPDFHERVRNRGVCLESIVVSDCNIQCTCRVMNWSFNKKVTARYTTNGWCSSSDINASYVPDSTYDGMDSFAFNIFLSQQRNDLEFAIGYTVNGKQHWDNNEGQNYKLSYHNNSAISTAVPSSPTWIHQFW